MRMRLQLPEFPGGMVIALWSLSSPVPVVAVLVNNHGFACRVALLACPAVYSFGKNFREALYRSEEEE